MRAALLVLLLFGCAGPVKQVYGPQTAAPGGWDAYCSTQPTPVECSKP